MGVLKIDALAGRISCEHHLHVFALPEGSLNLLPLFSAYTAVNHHDGFRLAQQAGDLLLQIIERVAMLGEDDQFPTVAGRVEHLLAFVENLREFIPLPVRT